MQARHRSPADRIGAPPSGQFSPDGSAPGQGKYGSGYRSFGRGGYRRAPPKTTYPPPPPPLPPPPPPSKADILLEAGRLAAEYLVTTGVLPPGTLPPAGRWANSGGEGRTSALARLGNAVNDGGSDRRRNNDGPYQRNHGRGRRRTGPYSRGHDSDWGRENGRNGPWNEKAKGHYEDGGDSSRSGRWMERSRGFSDAMEDEDYDRRDGFEGGGGGGGNGNSRAQSKIEVIGELEPKNLGFADSVGSKMADDSSSDKDPRGENGPWTETWNERARGDYEDDEDFDRSRRWSERGREFSDATEGEDYDQGVGFEDASNGGGNGGIGALKAIAADPPPPPSPKSEVKDEVESELKCHKFADDMGVNLAGNSISEKESILEAEVDLNRGAEDVKASDLEMKEAEKVKQDGESEVASEMEEDENPAVPPSLPVDTKQSCKHANDLLSFCDFAKVPTKTRSSIANRNPKTDKSLTTEEVKDTCDAASSEGISNTSVGEDLKQRPSSDSLTDQAQRSIGRAPEMSRALSVRSMDESVDHDPMFAVDSRRCSRSQSFPESSSLARQRQELSQGSPGFELSKMPVEVRMGDSFAEHTEREGIKQLKELFSYLPLETNEHSHNLKAKQLDTPVERLLPDQEMVEAVEQEQLVDAGLFPKVGDDSDSKMEEERQLTSSSFKICDLNLMEAPDITDISDLENIPTTSAPPIETRSYQLMDFGLSIGQSLNGTNVNRQHSNHDKVIPVIDLESDSPVEVDACDTSEPQNEPAYPNLENFLNQPENTVDLPETPDGYGLVISEFLGNNIANCPSVQGDINNLQGGMSFPGAEGIPGDDDSLYATLGEIPIGFMDVWDPPPQDYDKYF